LTLLAAPIDFTEAGKLTLFVDESEIDSRQMRARSSFCGQKPRTQANDRATPAMQITTEVVTSAGLAKLSENGTLAVRMMWMISIWVKRI
jgi:hypothetical protein